jgi:hypothetical protein
MHALRGAPGLRTLMDENKRPGTAVLLWSAPPERGQVRLVLRIADGL